jgi:glycosyltransferase involved in cell wall biosynthesis
VHESASSFWILRAHHFARAQGWIAGAGLDFEAMANKGFPKQKGRILNLAVDLSEFRPLLPAERTATLQELGLKAPVIGFVGRLTKAKGLDVLMQAMEQIGGARPWSLLLLGSGEYQEKVQAWAEKQGWRDRVRIKLVKHAEVPRYLGSMDLMVAPSQTMKNWREQFGRMLIEAFACGVPVVGSDSGEIPHVIGSAGRVVPEADVTGWAQAIAQLLDHPEERDTLRNCGLSRATQFSTATIAEQYREYYRWLVTQPLQ